MKDEVIATAVERFVKKISFSAQQELERVLRSALADGSTRSSSCWAEKLIF